MKAPIRVLMLVFLCAFSMACSSSGRIVEAKSGGKNKRVPAQAANMGVPARPGWRLGSPVTHNNLTIFPVLADDSTIRIDLITLDEGLRLGKVSITELGVDGRSQRVDRRQLSDNAEVNRLALINKSGKPLLLLAGEMILGGRQDRIVGHDCIIESSKTPVPLDVFCVEHGRWSGGVAFGENRQGDHLGQAATRSGPTSAQRAEQVSGGIAGIMALPNIREKAQAKKSQKDVWTAVSETVTVNATTSRTEDLNSVYQDKRVKRKIDAYERAFEGRVAVDSIVGVVVAIGGELVSSDVFANHSLFQAYWPKMLKSYALEAVSANQTVAKDNQMGARQVKQTDAELFLARVQGSGVPDAHEGIYRLKESQSNTDASFELEYAGKTPTLIHFNRVKKR